MRSTRAFKAVAAWVAALGIVMAALAPAVSYALRHDAGASWVQVCSALGLKVVTVDPSRDAPVPLPDNGHPFEHCPYCSLHAASSSLPPASTAALTLLALSFEAPRPFLAAPHSLFAWTAPRSRAPPRSA